MTASRDGDTVADREIGGLKFLYAAEALRQGSDLAELLLHDEAVRNAVGEPALRAALDPASYVGHSQVMAHEQAACARQAVAGIHTMAGPGKGEHV